MEKVTKMCDRCNQRPAQHTVSKWYEEVRGRVEVHLCCICHIADGGTPSNWHPDCMSEYANKVPPSKFKAGDRVRVVGYGHPIWRNKKASDANAMPYKLPIISEGENFTFYDMSPDLVGKIGVIEKASFNSVWTYSINGIPGKTAWYDEQQLELVN